MTGGVYDLSEASVSGDAFSGYTVTATIVDPDHGSFTIATTIAPILFACPDESARMSGAACSSPTAPACWSR